MIKQEDPTRLCRGGILADEMGMGKTIQTIALMLVNRVKGTEVPPPASSKKNSKRSSSCPSTQLVCANLVVCPKAAVIQWKREIERFSDLSVCIYHGQKRNLLWEDLCRFDVILTTYSTIESEYRSIINKIKVACKYCGRLFLPDKLKSHYRYMCGPLAERTAKQAKQERSRRSAVQKGLRTLGVTPTITNMYKEIMASAGIEDDNFKHAPWLRYRRKSEDNEASNEEKTITTSPHSNPKRRKLQEEHETVTIDSTSSDVDQEWRDATERLSEMGFPNDDIASALKSANGRIDFAIQQLTEDGDTAPVTPATTSKAVNGINKMKVSELRALAQQLGIDTNKKTKSVLLAEINETLDFKKEDVKLEAVKTEEIPCAVTSDDDINSNASATVSHSSAPKRVKRKRTPLVSSNSVRHSSDEELLSSDDGESDSSSSYHGDLSDDYSYCSSDFEEFTTRATSSVEMPSTSSSSSTSKKKTTTKRVPTPKKVSTFKKASISNVSGPEDSVEGLPLRSSVRVQLDDSNEYRTFDGDDVDKTVFGRAGLRIDSNLDFSSSPILSVQWGRIVLDEAHRIKARTNSTAAAIFALECIGARWCLTGTPIQNRVADLHALIRFLRFFPYAFYFCNKKGCNCFAVSPQLDDKYKCVACNHSTMTHFSYFNKRILKPILSFGYVGEGRTATEALKNEILKDIMLRRTKAERAADIRLPPLEVVIRRDKLSEAETDFYESLYKQSKTKFDDYVERGVILYNYAHIFDILSRLRQATDHPYLITHSLSSDDHNTSNPAGTCGLCLDPIQSETEEIVVSKCKHVFHKVCAQELIQTSTTSVGCPNCHTVLTIDFTNNSPPTIHTSKRKGILSRIDVSKFTSSTKIEALVAEISKEFEADSTCKAIVFSQFTAMLDLIEWRLRKDGFNCGKLTGDLTLEARGNILQAFNAHDDFKIILISLKAGGEGLNLQVANRIYLMDPWWNPAAELQAIQRAHRIGQSRPVKAVRFIAAGTVEEKILSLQEKKQLVFDGTIGSSNSAMTKLTAEDLRFLFG